jgi:hypothetical protein
MVADEKAVGEADDFFNAVGRAVFVSIRVRLISKTSDCCGTFSRSAGGLFPGAFPEIAWAISAN